MTTPWQLYVFCVVHLCYSFAMYGFVFDPCALTSGKSACKAGAETFAARTVAICFLYVGVFFLTLTILSKDSASKLKRLGHMALNCATALFVGVVFTGSRTMGGSEDSLLHAMDMIAIALLIVIMITAVSGDDAMESATPIKNGLGINPKGFVLLIAIATTIKLFVLNDYVDPSSFLANPDSVSSLSRVLWAWTSVCMFELILAIAFALVFGNAKDQEGITIATIFMMIISVVSILPIASDFKDGMMRRSYISLGVGIALAVGVVWNGRRTSSQGYETVSNVV